MKYPLTFAEAYELAFWGGAVIANEFVPYMRHRLVGSGLGETLEMRHTKPSVISTKWGVTPASILPGEVKAKWRVVKLKRKG